MIFIFRELLGKTKNLGAFVTTIPQLREKKRIIDLHTNVASGLLADIKAREIDSFFDVEMNILKGTATSKEVFSLLEDPTKGSAQDKARLFLVYFLGFEKIPPSDTEKGIHILKDYQIDLTDVIDYLKR